VIRNVIFWAHLVSGIAAGLVILVMSVTGVLLTYERQIVAFADRAAHRAAADIQASAAGDISGDGFAAGDAAAHDSAKPLEALLAAVKVERPSFSASGISVSQDPSEPVTVRAGRAGVLYVDRHTGQILGEGAVGVRSFFREIEAWHRWLGMEGERRGIARALTGAANFVFLCIVVSGLYLWLPRVARWAAFKTRLVFTRKARSGKARDFNWHHVIGFWSAIPLAVIAASGVVFSYPWANDAVYAAFGEAAPARGGRTPAARGEPAAAAAGDEASLEPAARLALDELLVRAGAAVGDWRTMTIDLSDARAGAVAIDVDRGNGGQPQLRSRLMLDNVTGDVLAAEPFSSQSPGRRARSMLRFLHTGEALGIVGQTIAGVVSAASLVMLWTGWALAYRRLVRPALARRRAASVC
jgi:uncharacterized iron-regulated membrane protein